jgi:hypothetical protein
MKRKSSSAKRPLLDWVLCRGRQKLACQVERKGRQYRVSVRPQGARSQLYDKLFDAGLLAFQRHAAVVAQLRRAGWQSVAYR